MSDISKCRRDFPLLDQNIYTSPLIYLDNAATTQLPRQVLDRMLDHYLCDNANVHRGIHSLSERSTAAYEDARYSVASFLGAKDSEIIFTSGTTDGINMLAGMYSEQILKPGMSVIVSQMEHHSNLIPWQEACKRSGAELLIAPITDNGDLDTDALRAMLSQNTALVAITAVSNVTGAVNPIEDIIQWSHSAGAAVLIDAAQALRHIRIDLSKTKADFLCFSGHKMCAPAGIGVLFARENRSKSLSPVRFGGGMVADVTESDAIWNAPPACFEAGTVNYPAAIGLAKALDYMTQIGLDEISAYEQSLINAYEDMLKGFPQIHILGKPAHRASAISFTLRSSRKPGEQGKDICPSAFDAAMLLDKLGVAVRSGHHCARPLLRRLGVEYAVRISPAFYNTFEEVEKTKIALGKVLDILYRK